MVPAFWRQRSFGGVVRFGRVSTFGPEQATDLGLAAGAVEQK